MIRAVSSGFKAGKSGIRRSSPSMRTIGGNSTVICKSEARCAAACRNSSST